MVPKAPRVLPDHKDRKAHKECKGRREYRAQRVPRVPPAHKGRRGHKDRKAFKALKERKEPRVLKG